MIQLLERRQIDDIKWNRLVSEKAMGLPYAYTWYLDAVADHWQAWVWDDYTGIYPFQKKRKYGLPYSLTPFLTQQLGYVGTEIAPEMLLELLGSEFVMFEQQWPYYQKVSNPKAFSPNHILVLNRSFSDIYQDFNQNTKRNIKKSENQNIQIEVDTDLTESDLSFIIKHSKIDFNPNRTEKLQNLCISASKHEAIAVYKVYSEQKLISLAIFILNPQRAVYLLAVSNKLGFEKGANFLIVKQFLSDQSEKIALLDFEGSRIEGVARFYKGFGATEIQYPIVSSKSIKPISKIFKK